MMPEQDAFLKSDNQDRIVLVELSYHDGVSQKTVYVSNRAYKSTATDSIPHQPYDDNLKEVVIKDFIDANIITGTITLFNNALDDWLTRAWLGWPFKVLVGSPDWALDNFIEIFTGVLGNIKATRDTIKFNLYDKRKTLQVPVQTNLLANNKQVPLSYGECFNVPAELVNVGLHEYQCHELAVTSFPGSRDNGIAVNKTDNLSQGKFTLDQSPFGDIRCDVIGETSGSTNEIFKALAKRTGLTDSDFDQSVDIFLQKQSLFINSNKNVDRLLTELCQSIGAYWSFNAEQKLQIKQFIDPTTPTYTLTPDDIQDNGITLIAIQQPATEIQFNYNKNWGVQAPDKLAETLTQADIDKYSTEYKAVASVNAGINIQHPLSETRVINTLLINAAEAQVEADRRALLRNKKRFIYKVICFTSPFLVNVGDVINIIYPGFGFENGLNAVVIKKTLRPGQNKVELEIWL